jgi:hypothetical protein
VQGRYIRIGGVCWTSLIAVKGQYVIAAARWVSKMMPIGDVRGNVARGLYVLKVELRNGAFQRGGVIVQFRVPTINSTDTGRGNGENNLLK